VSIRTSVAAPGRPGAVIWRDDNLLRAQIPRSWEELGGITHVHQRTMRSAASTTANVTTQVVATIIAACLTSTG